MQELGLQPVADFVGGVLIGHQYSAAFIDQLQQTRSSSQTGYMSQGLRESSNLYFYKSSLAKNVLFEDSEDPTTATAVTLETAGITYFLSANKEIVISAGAFRSPQLLMASGVGPKDTLDFYGIPLVADRPGVGQNLQDQPIFGPSYEVALVTHSLLANDPGFLGEQVASYNINRTGMITNVGDDFLAYEKLPEPLRSEYPTTLRSDLSTFPDDWPEIEWVFSDGWEGYALDQVLGPPVDGKNYVSAISALLTPFSRGNVSIASSDTAVPPIVNPNLLGDPRDMQQAVQFYKRARQIFETRSLAPIRLGAESFPGANVTSDSDLAEVIMQSASTIWHASCTCKMGRTDDPMAVVDSHARVIGTKRLRVVDASAFPFLPPIHPTATIYALAEKIAQLIKDGG